MLSACLLLALLAGCAEPASESGEAEFALRKTGSMELRYAQNFSVDYYEGGCAMISISDGGRFFVVPEGGKPPDGLAADTVVLRQPVDHIYLVASASMCLFDALDSLDAIRLSGTRAADWYIPNARAAMERGEILYAGKYSTPDYELILSSGCELAIESTMISHTPDVREKLEDLGIPVLVDQSSYEPHPLGRTEWIKLYAVLLGEEALAGALFAEQAAYLDTLADQASTDKTVSFFYISTAGYAVARRSGDYVTKMIELAGGTYVFDDLGDPERATGTVNLEMEEFYSRARDADVIFYNSAVGGEPESLDALASQNPLLADFKAVQTGDVWCTGKNLYQETTRLGQMIAEMHMILAGDPGELAFFTRLQ